MARRSPLFSWLHSRRCLPSYFHARGAVSGRMAIGVAVIGFGALLLIDNLLGGFGIRNPERFFWPIAFAAVGITMLIERRSDTWRYWAYGWLGLSAIEFAYQLYWIPFGVGKLIFPAIFILVGLRLIQRSANRGAVIEGETVVPRDQTRIVAVLSGAEKRTFTEPLSFVEVTSIMSGVKLDLTTASIAGERATLHITAFMGGVDIYAPSEWNIVNDVTPVLGAYVDKRRPTASPSGKTLVVSGMALMGGIEVKN